MKHRSTTGIFLIIFLLATTGYAQQTSQQGFETVAFESGVLKGKMKLLVISPGATNHKNVPTSVVYIPFVKNDSALLQLAAKCSRLLPSAMIVGISSFDTVPGSALAKPAVYAEELMTDTEENYDVVFNMMKDEIFLKMEEKYKALTKHGLVNTSENFTNYILSNYGGALHCYVSNQPLLIFDGRREIGLAKEFFGNYARYKNFDLSRVSAEEINWPDEMLIKLGVKLPIYFQE